MIALHCFTIKFPSHIFLLEKMIKSVSIFSHLVSTTHSERLELMITYFSPDIAINFVDVHEITINTYYPLDPKNRSAFFVGRNAWLPQRQQVNIKNSKTKFFQIFHSQMNFRVYFRSEIFRYLLFEKRDRVISISSTLPFHWKLHYPDQMQTD